MRPALVVPTLVLALAAAGCGGGGEKATPSGTASSSASADPTGSPASPTATPSADPSAQPSAAALELVPADQAQVPKGGCEAQPRAGLVCKAERGYRFQPDAVRRVNVTAASAMVLDQVGWTVDVSLGPAGTKTLASVTRQAVKTRQLVLVLIPKTRKVILAAQVQSPITAGTLQLSGTLTEAQARRIVKQITRTAG